MKKRPPSLSEAHFQVKMLKAHDSRSTSGSRGAQKCTPLWREAHFQVKKCQARTMLGTQKVHVLVARSKFRSQNGKSSACADHFRRNGFCIWCKVIQACGFATIPKALPGMGLSKRICKHAFHVAGAVQETCPSDM